ncbi:putative membrane protein [Salirhabdus euzebyi]|uniref:Putative membrane protein n=1 Tax=Salirhabdus euzebyi TaxID=394506 RepID=A0A841Q172_9BACI|nr:hypothetical protein [Salirhabdus euzebyi]MBB6451652.1 putative membrane protein [Salirhabdus euzebyi]
MEIIIGYIIGFIVLVLFFVSIFKSVSSRIKSEKRDMNQQITDLKKRLDNIEEKSQ